MILWCLGGGKLLVQRKHLLDKMHCAVVARLLAGFDSRHGESLKVLTEKPKVSFSCTFECRARLRKVKKGQFRVEKGKEIMIGRRKEVHRIRSEVTTSINGKTARS